MSYNIIFLVEPAQTHYVSAVREALMRRDAPAAVMIDSAKFSTSNGLFESASIVVTVHSLVPAIARVCDTLRGRVPTLTIQDGVIEYRHCMYHTRGVWRYMPLRTDAIAAFGEHSRMLLTGLGVEDSAIHVTGNPRFDGYGRAQPTQARQGPILITSANRPARKPEELVRYYLLMQSLFEYLDQTGIPFILRLTRMTCEGGLCAVENVAEYLKPEFIRRYRELGADNRTLDEDLEVASAVIITPSTVAFEAMAKGRPLALLNYDAETVLTPSVWRIDRPDDIGIVVPQLLDPPPMKARLQDALCRHCLAQDGAASDRVADLILSMAKI